MKKYIFFCTLLCMCLELSAQTYPKDNNAIRLLTYNTHYCKGGTDPGTISDSNTRLLASVIKTLNADIVSLQELDSAANSRGKRYLLGQIAQATGLDYTPVFGAAANWDGGRLGCGSLIKKSFPISKIKMIDLPGNEPRIAVRTDLEKFVFISTHCDLDDTRRIQEANIINNEVDYIRKPVFLAGDLNDSHRWGNGGIAFPILMEKFVIASDTKGNTVWNGSHGNEGDDQGLIDYILFHDYGNSGIQIVQTHIVRTLEINGATVDLKNVSDHYPVFVDIYVPGYSGITNIPNEENIIIYFNPVDATLYTKSENNEVKRIEVYTISGEKVIEMNDENASIVNMSNQPKGVYIVKASTLDKSLIRKIVKN
ncbi:endonuclease/exonuclease/phosphatase family protein [Coprobacter tertius]|uniref:T9SS type A sorting domain-containing protein n=1 Tax=Coprobacter tertius TaxID=2944915 RepID=A0ABT1MJJ2_9BACT|nr:endonuclease/exonuclease/phosphatase family protein [Coprobacter tertius]MCP9612775.1 T9SS type A sorting domain-containing protein [Coprobacter tertius]